MFLVLFYPQRKCLLVHLVYFFFLFYLYFLGFVFVQTSSKVPFYIHSSFPGAEVVAEARVIEARVCRTKKRDKGSQ